MWFNQIYSKANYLFTKKFKHYGQALHFIRSSFSFSLFKAFLWLAKKLSFSVRQSINACEFDWTKCALVLTLPSAFLDIGKLVSVLKDSNQARRWLITVGSRALKEQWKYPCIIILLTFLFHSVQSTWAYCSCFCTVVLTNALHVFVI